LLKPAVQFVTNVSAVIDPKSVGTTKSQGLAFEHLHYQIADSILLAGS
jgi:hypothetical protein